MMVVMVNIEIFTMNYPSTQSPMILKLGYLNVSRSLNAEQIPVVYFRRQIMMRNKIIALLIIMLLSNNTVAIERLYYGRLDGGQANI